MPVFLIAHEEEAQGPLRPAGGGQGLGNPDGHHHAAFHIQAAQAVGPVFPIDIEGKLGLQGFGIVVAGEQYRLPGTRLP